MAENGNQVLVGKIVDHLPKGVRVFSGKAPGDAALIFGLLTLICPTFISLAHWSWSSDLGAHGPIVLATGLWLIWRERNYVLGAVVQPFMPSGLALIALLPIYCVCRLTSTLMGEAFALYLIILTIAYQRYGSNVLRKFWFPCVYFLFIITPSNLMVSAATRPIKQFLAEGVVDLLYRFGMAIGRTGSIIQIDGYQVQVAAACSGVNSLIGITAITLFYVYLSHGSQPHYAAILTVLIIPVALMTNFLRIILLILATHFFGQELAENIFHDSAAVGMFCVALLLLFAIDKLLYPVFKNINWMRGEGASQ